MSTDLFPVPSREEEAMLTRVIEDWATRSQLQRAICLLVVRGVKTPEDVARELLITPAEVQEALRTVWGVLYDRTQNRYWIK